MSSVLSTSKSALIGNADCWSCHKDEFSWISKRAGVGLSKAFGLSCTLLCQSQQFQFQVLICGGPPDTRQDLENLHVCWPAQLVSANRFCNLELYFCEMWTFPFIWILRFLEQAQNQKKNNIFMILDAKERATTFGNRKRRNPLFVWTRNILGLFFHALVAVHRTVVGGHHSSVDSAQLLSIGKPARRRARVGCATREEASVSSRPAARR